MCGIVALWAKQGPVALDALPRMTAAMRHRGPDDEGFACFSPTTGEVAVFAGGDTPRVVRQSGLPFTSDQEFSGVGRQYAIGLGHRRLSIVDLSPMGHQPLCDASGRFWIVFNGEIYNFKEIKKELEALGHVFRGESDTEVALHAYMAWGDDCQERFNGMWVIVVYDHREQALWVSRDRFGIKPLYYFQTEDMVCVASEIKCFAPLIPLRPNLDETAAYLLDGPSEAHQSTAFDGVCRFPAGCSATIDTTGDCRAGLLATPYFEYPDTTNDTSFSQRRLREYTDEYLRLLTDAVRIRLRADVPVSCALSGGLDSSAITALAAGILRESGDARLTTISNVYYSDEARDCDESRFIDVVKDAFAVRSIRSEPVAGDILAANDAGLRSYENLCDDIPIAALNTFRMCREHGIKVNLDGQGADESQAGYFRFWPPYFAWGGPMRGYKLASLFAAPQRVRDTVRHMFGVPFRSQRRLPFALRREVDPAYRAERTGGDEDQGSVNDCLNRSVRFNLKKLLRNVDSYSMAHSIESRQPYMDYRLLLFLNAMPFRYKMHGGWTKFIARTSLAGVLPPQIVWRRDKMGWPQPLRAWVTPQVFETMWREVEACEALRGLVADMAPLRTLYSNDIRMFLRVYNIARQQRLFGGENGA